MSGTQAQDRIENRLKPGQYYGPIAGRGSCSDFLLTELNYEAPRKLPVHTHQSAYFSLLLGGNYLEQCGRRLIECKPMSLVFHPPDMTHKDEVGTDGGRFFNIEIPNRWLDRLREFAAPPLDPTDLNDMEILWPALRLYREFRRADACSELAMEGLILEMLALTARRGMKSDSKPPVWITKVRELLRDEFDQNLTVNSIAERVGVHPFHLSRVFRRFYGQSAGEYVHGLRIQRAMHKLTVSDSELAEIALEVGFADQSHFTRIFKQTVGMTPGAFRAALGKG